MASSTDKADVEHGKEVPPPKSGVPSAVAPPATNYFSADVALRFLLFAASLAAVVIIVTGKQTKLVPLPGTTIKVPLAAKFNYSPAFIYFVAALSVAGLYSIITLLASIFVIVKPVCATKFLLHFALGDVLILGLVASATGTAGGVSYVGLKGNKHTGWLKVCSTYDKFCQHNAGSLALSLFASVLLVLLIWISIFSIHRRIPK